jgi:prefoldin alpha subunit
MLKDVRIMTKEDVVRNLSLMEYYKEQLDSLNVQMQYMQAALVEYHKAKMTIERLHESGEKSEILIPIGGGTFIDGSIRDVSKVLVDIGAGVVAEKSVEDAIEKIDERIKKLEGSYERALSTAQKLQMEISELYRKTQKLMEEIKE